MEASSGNWELDSDEIASIASEDLHQHRPNRWTGPKSSWRTLTEEDRLLWQSMKQIQDRDLAVHLYNAFALKRHGRNPATAQDLAMQLENGQQGVWVPPKLWTAWPLKHRQVPKSRLVNSQHDEDEGFTFRRQDQALPSTELEEELSATILRTATRRFRRRKARMARSSIETPAPEEGEEQVGIPLSRESSADPGAKEEDEEMTDANEPAAKRLRQPAKTYEPVVSSNDDLSYSLLRPSVRHILAQLDATLSILNKSRVSGVTCLSDSSTEEESDSQAGGKRPRGRPRKQPGGVTDGDTTDADPTTTTPRRKRGRPGKIHVPEEGETHDEMVQRVARQSHRRLPTTPKDKDAAFEEWLRKGDEAIERERSLSRARKASQTEETGDEGAGGANQKKLARWGLRDWSDVLGAAALAGFSGDVVARATRRCADLFGEGMVLRKLNEAPASASGGGMETVEYRPQPIRLSSPSDADDESDDEADLVQRRVASRQASLARSRASSLDRASPESFRGRLSRTQSPGPAPKSPRSRSGSRSRSAGGLVFCPVPSCDRAAQGFSRKANLRRHLELVHQGRTEDVDSDDELVGAVHVDGFLRPIVPARGWRGEDTMIRKRKRAYGQRSKTASRATSVERDESS